MIPAEVILFYILAGVIVMFLVATLCACDIIQCKPDKRFTFLLLFSAFLWPVVILIPMIYPAIKLVMRFIIEPVALWALSR